MHDPHVAGRADRARAAVPPHRAVGAADRRARPAGRPRRPTSTSIVKFRLEIGQIWDLRLFDAGPGDRRLPARSSTLDPSNLTALRALEGLYEKTDQSEKYLEVLEAQLDASPSDAERVVAVRAHGRGVGGAVRQARPRRRGAREDRRDRQPQLRRLPRAGAPVPAGRQVGGAGRDLPQPHHGDVATSATRVDLYVAMGAGLRAGACRTSTARSRRTTTCCRSIPTSSARSTPSAACTRRSASGIAPST